jgi:hypothetical protein
VRSDYSREGINIRIQLCIMFSVRVELTKNDYLYSECHFPYLPSLLSPVAMRRRGSLPLFLVQSEDDFLRGRSSYDSIRTRLNSQFQCEKSEL